MRGSELTGIAALLDVQVLDILATTNPEARFALRVRVTPYPEGLFSCWVMLAVKHPQRDGA